MSWKKNIAVLACVLLFVFATFRVVGADEPAAEAASLAAQDSQADSQESTTEEVGKTNDPNSSDNAVAKEKKAQPPYGENLLKELTQGLFNTPVFCVFLITIVGYLLGRIEIYGVGLGTAGVFLVALVFGHFGYTNNSFLHQIGWITTDESSLKSSMKLVENIGLLCFVTSVGFIAGPKFFSNLKRNWTSYGLLAFIIIGSASLSCVAIILLTDIGSPMAVGILSGSLTTTPGFSAAKEALTDESLKDIVTIGHGIGYPFGVVGVVLFVQIIPKILGVNMDEERKKLAFSSEEAQSAEEPKKYMKLDPIGLGAFAVAIVLGMVLGKIFIPLGGGAKFALGNTGGALIVGLLLGHFGHLGPLCMRVSGEFLKSFREFGLVLFLIGAGVPGGGGFVDALNKGGYVLFLYGAIMELIPMLLGFLVARHVVKLCLLNNLGSITGGMTSTPALGALINSAKTDDVASAYAATYPFALLLVVLASQFLVTLL